MHTTYCLSTPWTLVSVLRLNVYIVKNVNAHVKIPIFQYFCRICTPRMDKKTKKIWILYPNEAIKSQGLRYSFFGCFNEKYAISLYYEPSTTYIYLYNCIAAPFWKRFLCWYCHLTYYCVSLLVVIIIIAAHNTMLSFSTLVVSSYVVILSHCSVHTFLCLWRA